ncbi:PE domain-containing protein [Mycolicibacterium sp.]|uniref:PE domain-containing protein n=1 Tax=Mycolicibacterium sp. TaxID=2320850 RepID=UPI0025EA4255|nr:PE domain-containing protein [Mycolicibacterium sp.]
MELNVNSAIIAASAATETGISAEMAAATSAAAAALTAVLPMGADLDSIEFAAALNAAGAAYIGTAIEHLTNRATLAGSQDVAAVTYTAADVVNNTALAL